MLHKCLLSSSYDWHIPIMTLAVFKSLITLKPCGKMSPAGTLYSSIPV